MGKEAYSGDTTGNDSPTYDDSSRESSSRIIEEKGIGLGEAADMYGDLRAAEEYGYVTRGLKSRHIQFIALGGTIGTGLFLGIGRAFTQAGPLSLLLGYSFTGFAVYAMIMSLGEMATWLPLPGAIPQFCSRYVDGAMGFAVGWNNWYQSSITLCAEIAAAALIIQYWNGAQGINIAAWISLIIVLVVSLNIFAVSVYGEAEFIFASIKIITIVGFILFAIIIDLGGGPTHDRLGFRYWNNPGAMKAYKGTGSTGRFLGLFSVLVNAAFSYGGVEFVAVAAGEAENPRHNIPKAVRRVFWRILFFYVLGSLAIGVLIPYNEPLLLGAIKDGAPGGAASPWVIAIYRASVPVLPSIINAVILTSASSSANAHLYIGSRYLYALAQSGQAPHFLLKCSKRGVPYFCVSITASISLLTYMSCTSGAEIVFEWFQDIVAISTLITWMSVSTAYIRFHAALKAQGIDRRTLVFRSPFQPYTAWFSLCFFGMIALFNGFHTFGPFDVHGFVTAYVGIPIYLALYAFWKIFKGTKLVRAHEADIHTGKAALDAADLQWPPRVARNWVERVWFWIA
ncbi:MAG: hypothetical protein L6R36_003865 [Xanthoria steineri]|nr:MAG: hypothetical protein L6R36_003865 [Xanthoria steineri]